MASIEQIQQELRAQQIDGWLFFDHHHRDPFAYKVLELSQSRHVSRRWYYFVPAEGSPRGLVHKIERTMLDSLPGEKRAYSSWQEQAAELALLLRGSAKVAMQYSPNCAIPYVATVDAGTIELVRATGVSIVSSADLLQVFEARLSPQAIESHFEAGRRVDRIRAQAFELVRERVRSNSPISEYDVKQFILERFEASGLTTQYGPDIAVNQNSSDPHYCPTAEKSAPIRPGDFISVDMWAKLKQPGSIYYDITWTGYCGDSPPAEILNVFEIVKRARDAAAAKVLSSFAAGQTLYGYQVDDAAREVIRAAGYAHTFFHRTGHSIGEEVHGNGANMDNLESHDQRRVLPYSCFSIEPGIYLEHFGIRSEFDILVDAKGPQITGEVQQELLRL
jgi:Xaa-Pro dipeptidase